VKDSKKNEEKKQGKEAWGRSFNGGSNGLNRNKLSQKEREKLIPC